MPMLVLLKTVRTMSAPIPHSTVYLLVTPILITLEPSPRYACFPRVSGRKQSMPSKRVGHKHAPLVRVEHGWLQTM